ncbi:glutathione S-transferase family protein [Sphingobium phenoxybenzoativorans]|uniref:Glutathione S-transferase family protein n=1 Tax=Sphingobium phenoxybenzoativorans TaxID=1592790 RepID=A0A975Q0U9_9SPHN|nr:glutathione S-transferase family protein [Sphingobium phenoxybenzoativorans]QUT05260.1 glutathione S-transferase family protein [Sphingobium phenoxybenzoativorans]
MAYTLITANRNYSSWSLRPWVLMKALGIAFTDRVEPFTKPVNYEDFRSFSPTGQVPLLIDGERSIWDSLGIALYLADRHDGVWPQDEAARAWAQCAVAEMHSGFSTLRNDCTMNVGVRVKPKAMSAALQKDVGRLAELWAQGLDSFGGPWLAGPDFSAVDAFFAPVAFRVRTYGLEVGAAGQAWVDRMLAHPAMQQWEAEALAEDWREASHEAELAACGAVLADYRTA